MKDFPPDFLSASPAVQEASWDRCLGRLADLAGADEGFYVLAVHSLVEAWLKAVNPPQGPEEKDLPFREKIQLHLARQGDRGFLPYYQSLRAFGSTYWETNAVRHQFAALDRSRAGEITAQLLSFSEKAGLGSRRQLEKLKSRVQDWYSPEDTRQKILELDVLKRRLEQKELKEEALQKSLLELKEKDARLEELNRELKALEALNTTRSAQSDRSQQKELQLRERVGELQKQVLLLGREREENQSAAAYLDHLLKVHRTSRSRLEFEQSLIQLSQEQSDSLKAFKPGQSFLIRGGAGTGKTLVLLWAVRILRSSEAGTLGYTQAPRVRFLTYTRTLTRYSRYLSRLLDAGAPELPVTTVSSFFSELHRDLAGTEVRIQEDLSLTELMPDMPKEFGEELENFVWARGLTREEYVDRRIPRTGRKHPLRAEARAEIWDLGERLLEEMSRQSLYSRAGHRMMLQRMLDREQSGLPDRISKQDVLAVDEVQDLLPVEVKLLARCAGSLIMAGDAGQSLYRTGFRFQDAGLDLAGRSRILKLSFRSTRPLGEMAADFLENCAVDLPDTTATEATRDGLPPRLLTYPRKEDRHRLVLESLEFYQKVMDYPCSSLAVLVPDHEELGQLERTLKAAQVPVTKVKDDETWMDAPGVRLCTIHSAKGLDFPCVITLIPKLPHDAGLSDEIRHRSQAGLVYVGITRALENQTVVLPEETGSSVLKALRGAFGMQL